MVSSLIKIPKIGLLIVKINLKYLISAILLVLTHSELNYAHAVTPTKQSTRDQMSFSVQEVCDGRNGCVQTIFGHGWITENASSLLSKIVAEGKLPNSLYLSSSGGDFLSSLKLGKTIHSLGLNTYIGSYDSVKKTFKKSECLSGCALAFLGGIKRHYGVHDTYGFNQFAQANSTNEVKKIVADYFQFMGVKPEATIYLFNTSSKTSIIDVVTAKKIGIINDVTNLRSWTLQVKNNSELIALVTEKSISEVEIVTLGIQRGPSNVYNLVIYIKPIEIKPNLNQTINSSSEISRLVIKSENNNLVIEIDKPNWKNLGSGFYVATPLNTEQISALVNSTEFMILTQPADQRAMKKIVNFTGNGLREAIKMIDSYSK